MRLKCLSDPCEMKLPRRSIGNCLWEFFLRPGCKYFESRSDHLVIVFLCAMLLLCSVCQGVEVVGSISKELTGPNQDEAITSPKPPQPRDINGDVSSAVENAKRILGIDSNSDTNYMQRGSDGSHNTQKLLEKIKREFATKILHEQKLDTVEESKIVLQTEGKEHENIQNTLHDLVLEEQDSYEYPNSLESYVVNAVTRDQSITEQTVVIKVPKSVDKTEELVVTPHASEDESREPEDVKLVASEENKQTYIENVNPSPKELPERTEEYLKSDILISKANGGDTTPQLINKDHNVEQEATKDTLVKEDSNAIEAEAENTRVDVPPVGSKIEQDVVSAIKLGSHSASNSTVLDENFFTDNGEKTFARFTDPKQLFTTLSSRNFTLVNNDARGAFPSAMTRNDTSPNVRKIVIISQNKGLQADDGSKDRFVPQKVDEYQAKEESVDIKAKEKIEARKKDTDKKVSNKKREEQKTSPKLSLFPTSVISDMTEKSEKSESVAELLDETVTPAVEKKFENDKESKDTSKSVKTVEESAQDKIEKDACTLDKEPGSKISAKVKELGADAKETYEETEKLDGSSEKEMPEKKEVEEERKEASSKTGEDRIDKEKSEKKDKKVSENEDTSSGKKQPDSQKKDKKKGEESEKPKLAETVGETGAIFNEEKNDDDTLETYSQFTQRVSAEKKNDATNGHGTNGHSKGSKVKGKNYASPDCGAKLVTANPESSHSSKVIHPNKDEYMLNKCRDKIWFIIELCESIRPQKFDIANFELFSNLPKDIQVLGNHRYPSRDWTSMGWFKGQEGNRGLQSFGIDTEDFFKYIKVEITSYYGSEFFCPVSSFQIYGLSEFEVIDTIEDPPDDDPFTEPVEETTGKKSKEEGKHGVIPTVLKNMFSGVLDVIKRGYRPSSSSSDPGEECYSLHPKFAVENDTCPMAGSLNYILSCYRMEYEALMLQPFVSSTVKNSSFCRQLASTMCREPEVNDTIVYDTVCNNSYVCVMLSPKHVLAMCFMQDPSIMAKGLSCESGETLLENYSATSDFISTNAVPTYVKNAVINTSSITRSDASDSEYRETLVFDSKKLGSEVIKEGKLTLDQSLETRVDSIAAVEPDMAGTENSKSSPKDVQANGQNTKDKKLKESDQEVTIPTADTEENVDVEGSGFGALDIAEEELPAPEETNTISSSSSSIPPQTEPKVSNSPTNKESVVVRLSNKIKALEYNMSISSQYLEELSRRYKRQMEEMQRQFNLTIAALNDTSWQAYERDQSHQRDIEKLEQHLANVSDILQRLVDERESLAHTVVEQHMLLMIIEVIVLCVVFTLCSRRRDNYIRDAGYTHARRNQTPSGDDTGSTIDQDSNRHSSDTQGRVRVRRRSVDSITSDRNSRLRKRRPSEEALNITGTYQDLLIIEPAIPILMDSVSDRKKKRKSGSGTLKRSKSNASIVDKALISRRAKRIEKLNMCSAGVLFCGDEVDSKIAATPSPCPVDTLESYPLVPDLVFSNGGGIMCDQVENYSFHSRSLGTDIGPEEKVQCEYDAFSKTHSIACCLNCDNVQNKGTKLSKSMTLCSAPEKTKSTQEKIKKVKKQKRAKIADSINSHEESSQSPYPFHEFGKDYYYPKPETISYTSPIESYVSYYYNGHSNVHFSDAPNEHCNVTYNCIDDVPVNGGFANGINASVLDHCRHNNELTHSNHDTFSVNGKKKLSPKVKSKVKLRSDNWEWYSSQHLGSSSSETISTCSDSSGRSHKVKKELDVINEKTDEKKGKRRKKPKNKSPVLLEETVLEVESRT